MLTVTKDQIILFFVQNTCLILYCTFLSSQEHFQGASAFRTKTLARAKQLNLGCGNKCCRNLECQAARSRSAGPGSRKQEANRESSCDTTRGRQI